MDLIDAEFLTVQDRVFSIFILSLLTCLNFLKIHHSCLHNHFLGGRGEGGAAEGLFFAKLQPFLMTIGYRNVTPLENC